MIFPLIVAYILNLFDFAATSFWVQRFGIDIEMNPFGRWLYSNGYACGFKVVGVGVLCLFLGVALKHYPKWSWTAWVILCAYSVLAVYHCYAAYKVFGGFVLQ